MKILLNNAIKELLHHFRIIFVITDLRIVSAAVH